MDWQSCITGRIVKEAKTDSNKIASLMEISGNKLGSAKVLGDEHYYAKVSLLYDALRELLECIALERGFKIYNHECYTAFLKEIALESSRGDQFDTFRKVRNGINYYGKKITPEEGKALIAQMLEFITFLDDALKKQAQARK
jgi:hypothetical protein